MSTEYNAHIFFGTHAPVCSPVGEKLDKWIAEYSPREVAPGIVIDWSGSQPTGDLHVIIGASESVETFTARQDPVGAPRPLADGGQNAWRAAVLAFLVSEGIDATKMAPIGWHFGTRCG